MSDAERDEYIITRSTALAIARAARDHIAMPGAWPYPPIEPTQEHTMTSPTQRRHDEIVALLTEIRDRLPEYVNPTLDWLDEPTPVPRPEPKGTAAASAPLRPGEYILNRDGSAYRVVGTSEPGGDDEAQEDPDGEPVEPGDLRAGDRVAFTWLATGERITCTLMSHRDGEVLRSDAPDRDGFYPNVTLHGREWCVGISDVRLIERAPLAGELDAAVWHRQFEKEKARAEKAEADLSRRGELLAWAQTDRDAAERRANKAEAERDDWQAKNGIALANQEAADEALREELARSQALEAKHAALREDVERERGNLDQAGSAYVIRRLDYILDRDDARTPQADPDTVTLRREDVAALLDVCVPGSALSRRVREALAVADAVLGGGER